MRPFDPIALIDAAYEPSPSADAWVRRTAAMLAEVLDEERGGYGAYHMGVDGILRSTVWIEGRMTRPELELALAGAAAFAGRCASEDYVRAVQTALGLHEAFEMTRQTVGGYDEQALACFPSWIVAAPYVAAPDGEGGLLTFGFHRSTPFLRDPKRGAVFKRIAIHLGAGFRLARRREGTAQPEFDWMLDERGEVVHSTVDAETREGLRRAALAISRARRSDAESAQLEAIETWQGLFSGRWSLVDHFADDGRRYVVAVANEPKSPGMGQLSPSQRQVLFYASLGWTNADIGYALGLRPSTVATHLSRGLESCGIPSRAQLISISTALAMSILRARTPAG